VRAVRFRRLAIGSVWVALEDQTAPLGGHCLPRGYVVVAGILAPIA
jgi:hypothetical protein